MVNKVHYIVGKLPDATLQVALPPHVEGDRAEVTREGRDLLEPSPPPETQAVDQHEGRPLSVNVIVYARLSGDGYGHVCTSRLAPRAPLVGAVRRNHEGVRRVSRPTEDSRSSFRLTASERSRITWAATRSSLARMAVMPRPARRSSSSSGAAISSRHRAARSANSS